MKETIVDLEERLRLAMLNSDTAELNELISGDLLFTNHAGMVLTKEQDLKAHTSKIVEFTSLELSDFRIKELNESAIVSVKADIQGFYNGEPANGCFRFTRFWSNVSGSWQVIAGHSSVIA